MWNKFPITQLTVTRLPNVKKVPKPNMINKAINNMFI
jgi:hypothetical protein